MVRKLQLGDDWEENVSDKRVSFQCRHDCVDAQAAVLGTTCTDEQELKA